MDEFQKMVAANWTVADVTEAVINARNAYIAETVDSLIGYVAAVGDARVSNGEDWAF